MMYENDCMASTMIFLGKTIHWILVDNLWKNKDSTFFIHLKQYLERIEKPLNETQLCRATSVGFSSVQ